MAIKAGLVGVNPKGVDKNGMPIGSGGSADAYTKTETNTLLAGKVDKSQLTANNKAFHFAYDSTSEKYGYKLDGTGDFIPFESAGGGPGWVKPANLITTGIDQTYLTVEDGGYYVDEGMCYIDVVLKTANAPFKELPKTDITGLFMSICSGSTKDSVLDVYNANHTLALDNASNYAYMTGFHTYGSYVHIWGSYPTA